MLPFFIFSRFSCVWKSSPSANSKPNFSATFSPIVDFPHPLVPMMKIVENPVIVWKFANSYPKISTFLTFSNQKCRNSWIFQRSGETAKSETTAQPTRRTRLEFSFLDQFFVSYHVYPRPSPSTPIELCDFSNSSRSCRNDTPENRPERKVWILTP